jgi:hypothetical protein
MELFCVVAHLLHAVKAHAALFADVLLVFMRHLLVLHEFFDLAKLFAALFAFVLCGKEKTCHLLPLAVPCIPAFPAHLPLDLPGRLGVVADKSHLGPASGAKVQPFGVLGLLFVKARLAQKRPGFHFPLPARLDCDVAKLCLAHGAVVRLFLFLLLRWPRRKLFHLFDVAVAAQIALYLPFILGLVLVFQLPAAKGAHDWLSFTTKEQDIAALGTTGKKSMREQAAR